jgi:hypothetical protein
MLHAVPCFGSGETQRAAIKGCCPMPKRMKPVQHSSHICPFQGRSSAPQSPSATATPVVHQSWIQGEVVEESGVPIVLTIQQQEVQKNHFSYFFLSARFSYYAQITCTSLSHCFYYESFPPIT